MIEARNYYFDAIEWANEKSDKALIDACKQALKAIETSDPNAGSLHEDLPEAKPRDASVEAMVSRSREQYMNSTSNGAGTQRVSPNPSYDYFLGQKSRLEDRLRVLRASAKHDEATEAEQSKTITNLNWTIDYLNEMVRKQPELRSYQQKLEDWQADEEKQFARGAGLNTEPALKTVGSDYYTKNYGTAAAQTAPKSVDPNEMVATEERMIIDAHSVPGKTISRIVKVPVETKPSNADLNVHGNVVPEMATRSVPSSGKTSRVQNPFSSTIPRNL